ncbi:MAG: hypothetical protein SNJ67_01395 [Chloracidobacterium sp.]
MAYSAGAEGTFLAWPCCGQLSLGFAHRLGYLLLELPRKKHCRVAGN